MSFVPRLNAFQRVFMCIFAAIAAVSVGVAANFPRHAPPKPHPSSVVKVILANGHGSGVSIGGGYVLTAGHVAVDGVVSLKNSLGVEQPAEVLWYNRDYDVSVIMASKPEILGNSPLSCRIPNVGEEVIATGSPLDTEFTSYWGHVNSGVIKTGMWKEAVSLDMTIVPGISGGPLFDKHGNVVGIAVGVATFPFGLSPSLTGIGFAVPGSTICKLLARS